MESKPFKNLKSFRMTESTNTKRKLLLGNVRIYKNVETAKLSFFENNALSVLKSNKGFGILFYENGRNRGGVTFLSLDWHELDSTQKHGLNYWRWGLTSTQYSYERDITVEDFGVLLPMFGEDRSGYYTLVTKDWDPCQLDLYGYSPVGMRRKKEREELGTFEEMKRISLGIVSI